MGEIRTLLAVYWRELAQGAGVITEGFLVEDSSGLGFERGLGCIYRKRKIMEF